MRGGGGGAHAVLVRCGDLTAVRGSAESYQVFDPDRHEGRIPHLR